MLSRARLEVFEANWGRNDDWWIELDGRRLGRLRPGVWVDMFWFRYEVDAVDDDARRLLADRDLWLRCKLTFRSARFDRVAPHAHCGGGGLLDDSTVMMRALCVDLEPTVIERLILWWRRLRRSRASLVPSP